MKQHVLSTRDGGTLTAWVCMWVHPERKRSYVGVVDGSLKNIEEPIRCELYGVLQIEKEKKWEV